MRLRSVTPCLAVTLWTLVLMYAAPSAWAQSTAAASDPAKPPYNIIFIISDQEADHLLVNSSDYELPARAEMRRRGFDFRNHYTAAAMCTPSRAAFFSGTPPQVTANKVNELHLPDGPKP